MKTDELIDAALDWAVANPGKVSRYMPLIERLHRQSQPVSSGCREWVGKRNGHGNVECRFQDCSQTVCTRVCIEYHIWIRESQMPEYLAARLTRETT